MSSNQPGLGTISVDVALPSNKSNNVAGYQTSGHSSLHLTLYNAHNGQIAKLPKPLRFHTIASFKNYILEQFLNFYLENTDNIFLLTLFGMKFNFNVVNEVNEVYVYDKRLFSNGNNKADILQGYLLQFNQLTHSTQNNINGNGIGSNNGNINTNDNKTNNTYGNVHDIFGKPPHLTPAKSISQMSTDFRANETWARNTLRNFHRTEDHIKQLETQINTIFKCISNVFLFGLNFVNGIEKHFQTYNNHIKLISMKTLHKSWEKYYNNLERNMEPITLKNLNGKIITISLSKLLLRDHLNECSVNIKEKLPKLVKIFDDMNDVIKKVDHDRLSIDGEIETLRNKLKELFKANDFQSKNSQLLSQVKEYSNELSIDLDILSQSNSSDENLKKIYEKHINNLLPNIYEIANELHRLHDQYLTFAIELSQKGMIIYSSIANLQLRMVDLKSKLKKLTTPEFEDFDLINSIKKDEDYLSLTIDIPLLFGFMLIEKRRQYEWNDFFLKGVVKNVLEQLTVIIEYEKKFQNLWIKKFGSFLSLLDSTPRSSLPSLDITLLNGQLDREMDQSLLRDVIITRDNIIDYIKVITKFGQILLTNVPSIRNFQGLLEKNFLELIKCTENLKRATKIVASLSLIASDEENLNKMDKEVLAVSQKLQSKFANNLGKASSNAISDGVDLSNDTDLDVIKGLRSRIKKLENLLHQQQYKNLSQWPVTRGPFDSKSNFNDSPFLQKSTLMSTEKRTTTDPTMYLSKNLQSPNANSTPSPNFKRAIGSPPKVLDASTTIDKHLDNIRLRKENAELKANCDKLLAENRKFEETISELRNEILLMKQDSENIVLEKDKEYNESLQQIEIDSLKKISKANDEFDDIKENLEKQVESLKQELVQAVEQQKLKVEQEKDILISQLQNEVSKYVTLSNDRYDEFMKSNKALEAARNELNDTLVMKNDLLQNLLSKDAEFVKERNAFEEEIKQLKSKVDEMTDDYEDLMEITQSRQNFNEQHVDDLTKILSHLLAIVKILSETLFNFYYDFCLVLELMGLLLIEEEGKLRILRVKGLRNKKGEIEEHDVSTIVKPNSKVIEHLESLVNWFPELTHIKKKEITEEDGAKNNTDELNKELIVNLEIASRLNSAESRNEFSDELIKIYKQYFEGEGNKMDIFIERLEFPSELEVQGHTGFVLAISRRFRDVEGFAKKLTKDIRTKTNELNKEKGKNKSKISINNFQVGDLVLFLPTRIENESSSIAFKEQPWAAFNFGLPHYFLNVDQHNLKGKDWMVGKIEEIESIKIREDNKYDVKVNPYHLMVGEKWFNVETEEVKHIV